LTVKCQSGQLIYDGFENVSEMYMHDAERLWLAATGDHWEVVQAQGNFYSAGESFGGRKQMRNTAILNGSIINRADMPRLAKFALSLTTGQAIVTDTTWLSDPSGIPIYRGCFSLGNGATTLRLPDERGLFDRYLDMGRGLDNSRYHRTAGGYEADEIKSHRHTGIEGDTTAHNSGSSAANGSFQLLVNTGDSRLGHGTITNGQTGLTGGNESRPKNISKIPLIRY
jgi:hypothetical protein